MKMTAYVLIGIITYLLQAQFIPALFYHGWQPNLILVWVVLVSLIKGRQPGLIVAIIGGVVHDILIGNFFGLHFFPYVILAYLFSMAGESFYEEQWYISFLAVVAATVLDGAIRMGMLYMARENISFLVYAVHYIWPAIWANAVIGIVIHEILWRTVEKDENLW